jgi:Rod binding domain-containing protein
MSNGMSAGGFSTAAMAANSAALAADPRFAGMLASAKPTVPNASSLSATQLDKAAKDFEAVFINEMLGAMFEGIKTDGPFGGGPGEGMFRSMMIDQYARTIAQQGGFGLASSVKSELLRAQEKAGQQKAGQQKAGSKKAGQEKVR